MTRGTPPPGRRSRTVDLDGVVHLTDYGAPDAAEVVVCLHGLGGSALNFDPVGPLLAESRRVLVPDLLGHGRSFATAPDESALDAQLRMLGGLLAKETQRPVVLVGHSMGAIIAILHALSRPDTVESLVLLDPPVPNVTRRARDPRLTAKLAVLRLPGVAALVARRVARMPPEQLVARQLADATPHADRVPTTVVDATVAEVRAARANGGQAAQRAQFRAVIEVVELLARPGRWRHRLSEIAAPTLWLHGADDPLSELDAARSLASTRPGWTFGSATGSGTCPTWRTLCGPQAPSRSGWTG